MQIETSNVIKLIELGKNEYKHFHPNEWEAPLSFGSVKVIWKHWKIEDYIKIIFIEYFLFTEIFKVED